MGITELKKRLYNNPEKIIELLEYYRFYSIHKGNKEIRCARDKEGNKTSIRIKLNENLTATDFSRGSEGDIFSIICSAKNYKLHDVLQDTKAILKVSDKDLTTTQNRKQAFGGFFENLRKRKNTENYELQTFNEDILNEYNNGYNLRFLVDGISLKTQKKFSVGYCDFTNRITVPWRSLEGDLVGIMGRYNGNSEYIPKWFPVIPFAKKGTLFGYSDNYIELMNNDVIYIGESEKFVLQLDTMGYNNCVSLGCNSISEYQIKAVLKTFPKKIIMCYDEGLDLNIIIEQCLKIKKIARLLNIKVGYVYDYDNVILEKGSKNSPSDVGKENFERLVSEYVKWIE